MGILIGSTTVADGSITAAKRATGTFYMFYPVIWGDALTIAAGFKGPYQLLSDNATDTYGCIFSVPPNFVSTGSIEGVILPSTTANGVFDVTATWSEAGGEETYGTHSGENLADVVACVDDRKTVVAPLDLTGLTTLDSVHVTVRRQGGHASDTLGANAYGVGVLFTYLGYQ